jgi:hypothetical protein
VSGESGEDKKLRFRDSSNLSLPMVEDLSPNNEAEMENSLFTTPMRPADE